jgi:hypothetical protein
MFRSLANAATEGEFWGSHGDKYEDGRLLRFCSIVCQILTDVSETVGVSVTAIFAL